MFNFVQVQGQFRRIAELDKIYLPGRARGMDAPSQRKNIALKLHFVQPYEYIGYFEDSAIEAKGDVLQRSQT